MSETPRGITAVQEAFRRRHTAGGKIFVPYIVAGDPDASTSLEIAASLCEAGVDILELGMPFSDPLADGPVNQRAAQRALEAGMTYAGLLEIVKKLRSRGIETPIICMTYVNPIMKRGYAQAAEQAAQAGLDGFIVVDVPVEEAEELRLELNARNLAMVSLIAPTSTDERMRLISSGASGFLYYVSRTGVTGEKQDLATDLERNLGRIHAISDLPVVVGFGIHSPEQAAAVACHGDGVVVGSGLVHTLETAHEGHPAVAVEYVRPLLEAVHKAGLVVTEEQGA